MFLKTEERPAGEVQQVGKLKLSEAIRKGCEMSSPTSDLGVKAWVTWRGDRCFSCLIGAAWLGFEGAEKGKYCDAGPMYAEIAKRSSVDILILVEAAHRYERLAQPREQVADWLAAQGL
jgi:hypothetical protein